MKQQTTNIKVMILIIGFALIGLMIISNVSAVKLLCLTHGQSVPSESVKRLTCTHDICQVCVTDRLNPTNPNFCNQIGGCTILGGDSTVDLTAPVLVVNSPVNDNIYKTKQVLFDMSADEIFTFYWKDNSATGNQWRRVAAGLSAYRLGLSLKEGLNNITIRAMDRSGNSKEYPIQFYIDTKKPVIKKTLPLKGFSKGLFSVQFADDNPSSVELHYGNDAVGIRTSQVDLNSCNSLKGIYDCNVSVDVFDFNNQNIKYWFIVNDIANNSVASKTITLGVDTINPVILNPDTMVRVSKTNVYFNLSISEQNFAGAYYKITSDTHGTWKTVCTRLQNGLCAKKDIFTKKGDYDVDIKVVDGAGNTLVKSTSFSIV